MAPPTIDPQEAPVSTRAKRLTLMLVAGLAVVSPAGGAAAKQLGRDREFAPRDEYVHSHLSAPSGSPERSFLRVVGPSGFFGSSPLGVAPVGAGPSALAADPATHTIYVGEGFNPNGPAAGGNTVSVIDSRHCSAQDVSRCRGPWPTVTVGNGPSSIAIDRATDTVYVTNNSDNTVSVFNGAICNAQDTSGCGQTPATVPVGSGPIGVFADHANHTVYVANFNDGTVSMINIATCNATDLASCPTSAPPGITVAGGPGDVDVNQRTHTVYVATLAGLSVVDANTCNVTVVSGCATIGEAAVPPCDSTHFPWCGPFSAKVDAANNTVYESDGTTTVFVFDGRRCNASDLAACATDTPGAVTPFPEPGFEADISVVVDVALHSVYVTYQKDDALIVIDANRCNGSHLAACATLTPAEFHTGSDPESAVLDPQTQTLYSANEVDNTVSVIPATHCDAQTTRGCRDRVPEVPISAAGLAADPAVGTTYVATGSTAVSMINTGDCNAFHTVGCHQTPSTVTVGTNPDAIAVNPATHTVYVANQGPPGATGTISTFGDRACNATEQAGCSTVSTLQVPDGNPVALAVNPLTDTIYVATLTSNGGPDLISVFDGAACNATNTTGCHQAPANAPTGDDGGGASTEDVAVDQATNTIYATSDTLGNPFVGRSVFVIKGATCDATDTSGCAEPPATVDVGSNATFGNANPFGIAVDQGTNTIYTANILNGEGPGTVSVINGAACNGEDTSGCSRTPATAPAGFGTKGIAVNQITNQIYATNIEDTSVTSINGNRCNGTDPSGCDDTRTHAIVGDYPGSISVDPFVGSAYVADSEGVSVLRLTP
jgi:DNA-binding beta-propeller fold protein YncE